MLDSTVRPAPAGPPPAGPRPRWQPLAAEALGYLGGVLALVAGFIVARRLWPSASASAELAFAAVAASGLLVAGLMLRTDDNPAFRRLRSVAWLGSAASLGAFAGLLIGPHFWDLGRVSGPLVAEAIPTAYGVALWWRSRAVLQHLAVFAGLAALTGTAIDLSWPTRSSWGIGLGLWVLSLLWGIAVHRGYLVPRTAGYVAAGIGLLAGAQTVMILPAGQALAVATVAGLLAAGVAARRVVLIGFGAVGALGFLPQVATGHLHDGTAAAVAVFAVGLVLVGAALWLARARSKA